MTLPMQWEEHQTKVFDVVFGNVSSAVTHQFAYFELFVADAGGGANIHGFICVVVDAFSRQRADIQRRLHAALDRAVFLREFAGRA